MRAQNYRPEIRNGSVAKRQTRSKVSAVSKAFGVSKSSSRSSTRASRSQRAARYRRHGSERGSRIMWTMIFIGTVLAAGFVLALRSQINAYQLGQAEEQLKAKLDEYAGQQRYLMLDQQRARSTGESDRAGKQAGLDQLRLNQPDALRSSSVQKPPTAQKASMPAAQKAQAQKISAQKVSVQKASMPVRSNQADQRNQSAKTKRDGGNQRHASRSQVRR